MSTSFTVDPQSLNGVGNAVSNLHGEIQEMIKVPPEVTGRLAGDDIESAIRMFSAWLDAGMTALNGEVGDAANALHAGARKYQDDEDGVCQSFNE